MFETNSKFNEAINLRKKTVTILAGLNIALGVYCVLVPKACFGSCPTFYINDNNNFHYADAEGFSNAILPSLEYGDIDALGNSKVTDSIFYITMKNEALETHCVKSIKLLAYPRKENERIYHTPYDEFYLCNNIYTLTKAIVETEDISVLLKNEDKIEYASLADKNNMKSKEKLILNFNNIQNTSDMGLILHFRQSLMTTYLLYSAYDYMGNQIGDLLTKMETGKSMKNNFGFFRNILGDIDIYLWDENNDKWIFQNSFYETGPIAINKQMIPLDSNSNNSEVKIKIVINKGLWKIDYVALTNIIKKVNPVELYPDKVLIKDKSCCQSLKDINNNENYLISMPGDQFKFMFKLPEKNTDYELFLYSKGYYLSWIHEDWTKETNMWKLRQMLKNPERFLKKEAEAYKIYESKMEEIFWNSRIDKNIFSNYSIK